MSTSGMLETPRLQASKLIAVAVRDNTNADHRLRAGCELPQDQPVSRGRGRLFYQCRGDLEFPIFIFYGFITLYGKQQKEGEHVSATCMSSAQARRERELRQLAAEGVPLRTFGKSGHWLAGPLHIYTASGRWFHEGTGKRDRLNGARMRSLLEWQCEEPTPAYGRQPRPAIEADAERAEWMKTRFRKYEQHTWKRSRSDG